MKLLLTAAFRNRRHLTLAISTLIGLLFLTIANQCEMFSVGLMANTEVDFFSMFSGEGKKSHQAQGAIPMDQDQIILAILINIIAHRPVKIRGKFHKTLAQYQRSDLAAHKSFAYVRGQTTGFFDIKNNVVFIVRP